MFRLRCLWAASAVFAGALVFSGCDTQQDVRCATPYVTNLDSERLIPVPDTLTVDGRVYRLNAFAWRDFMPVTRPDGEPLRVSAWLVPEDTFAVPASITIRRLEVVYTNRMWIADVSIRRVGTRTEAFAECGPMWGPGVEVDVIAEVDAGQPALSLVARRVVPIIRTE